MNLEPFHRILNKAMGLSPDSLGRSGVLHALEVRMRCTGCNEASYLKLLRSDEEELSELIEEIVVPETWFFRDGKPYELLFETAFKKRKSGFRVLSAPCSTGEEPYSIAMTLLGAGYDPSKFRVDGVDISRKAIEKARNGVYTENSFRTPMPHYAENFFSRCEQGRKLAENVLKTVNFYTGNIVEGCLPDGKYNAIFCRNLLIYLDEQSKTCLAQTLNEKLEDDGLLFVGHAELLPLFRNWFTPVRKQGTFALRKGRRKQTVRLDCNEFRPGKCTLSESKPVQTVAKTRKNELQPKAEELPRPWEKKVLVKEPLPGRKPPDLNQVRELADRGFVEEALKMCREIIKQNGPAPDLYHLCGLLHEARGDIPMAEDCYGKALYLEPQHVESLIHLALLLENRGENRKAELLKNRVRRAENR